MATIGTFKNTGDEFTGEIVTLTMQGEHVSRAKSDWNSDYEPDDYFEPLMDAFASIAKAAGADVRATRQR